jgi:hypothetical protein
MSPAAQASVWPENGRDEIGRCHPTRKASKAACEACRAIFISGMKSQHSGGVTVVMSKSRHRDVVQRLTVQTRLCAAFRVLVSVVNHAPVRRSRQR